jgi:hypothetical protein
MMIFKDGIIDKLYTEKTLIVAPKNVFEEKNEIYNEIIEFQKIHSIGNSQIFKFDNKKRHYKIGIDLCNRIRRRNISIFVGFLIGEGEHQIQCGIKSPLSLNSISIDKNNFTEFVYHLSRSSKSPTIILYSFRKNFNSIFGAGKGEDNFSDYLRYFLSSFSSCYCKIISYAKSGSIKENPYIKIYEGSGHKNFETGAPILSNIDSEALKEILKTSYRFKFPFLSVSKVIYDIQKTSKRRNKC